jgi:hypothetical protein
MSLVNVTWSTVGKFRAGGAIGFGGGQSYGVAKHSTIWDKWGPDITLGLTIHPVSVDTGVIVSRAGSFQLSMAGGHLIWSVTTTGGSTFNVTSRTVLSAGGCRTLKLTYNSTSAEAKILTDNQLDAAALHPMLASSEPLSLGLAASTSDIIFGGAMPTAGAPVEQSWEGAAEEIYLKNISTENRQVYIYTDVRPAIISATFGFYSLTACRCGSQNVRPTSAGNVRVFDLSHPHGRTYYAHVMSNILNAGGANFDTTQCEVHSNPLRQFAPRDLMTDGWWITGDGFEILLVR